MDDKPSAQDAAEAKAYMEAEFRILCEKMFSTLTNTYNYEYNKASHVIHLELNKLVRSMSLDELHINCPIYEAAVACRESVISSFFRGQ